MRFRWVQCQVDWLRSQRTANDVRAALKVLPATLEDTYSAMLNRVQETDKHIAQAVLLWLSYAITPLTLSELCEIVVVKECSTTIDDDDRLQDEYIIPEICQGLVTYNKNGDYFTLAHFSVKEYLTSPRRKEENSFYFIERKDAHTKLAAKCLTYLGFSAFEDGACDDETFIERHLSWPLLDYATWSWAAHIKALGNNIGQTLRQQIYNFVATYKKPNGGQYRSWIRARYAGHQFLESPPLYYMCSLGLTAIVREMIEVDPNVDVNLVGGRFQSPIVQVAAYRGHYETVKLLLEAGSDPNMPNIRGETALFWADLMGYVKIQELLLEHHAISEP